MSDEKQLKTYSGYYAIEQNTLGAENIAVWLNEQGIGPDVDREGGGGGMLFTLGDLVIDTGGAGSSGSDENEERVLEFGAGTGHMSVGRIIFQNNLFRVYPLVGLGGTGASLQTRPPDDDEETSSTGIGSALFSGGLAVDFTPRWGPFYLVIGIRLGFYLGLVGNTKDGAPSGPFFRIVIGGGMASH